MPNKKQPRYRIKRGHVFRLTILAAIAIYSLYGLRHSQPGVDARRWFGAFVLFGLATILVFVSGFPDRARHRRRARRQIEENTRDYEFHWDG